MMAGRAALEDLGMKKFAILAAASLALAACSSGGDADKDGDGNVTADEAKATMGGMEKMTPGEYEMKISFSEVDIPGMPETIKGQMTEQMGKGVTFKHCITAEQAENPGTEMFGQKEGSGCKMESLKRSGSNMTATMKCDQPGGMKMAMNMDGDFRSDGYSMKIDQKMSGMPGMSGGGEMTMKGALEAKRLGDCPK
jgi:hypothetical protein